MRRGEGGREGGLLKIQCAGTDLVWFIEEVPERSSPESRVSCSQGLNIPGHEPRLVALGANTGRPHRDGQRCQSKPHQPLLGALSAVLNTLQVASHLILLLLPQNWYCRSQFSEEAPKLTQKGHGEAGMRIHRAFSFNCRGLNPHNSGPIQVT